MGDSAPVILESLQQMVHSLTYSQSEVKLDRHAHVPPPSGSTILRESLGLLYLENISPTDFANGARHKDSPLFLLKCKCHIFFTLLALNQVDMIFMVTLFFRIYSRIWSIEKIKFSMSGILVL